ncbi:hypothetical protein TU94_00215 [Streptomyces cyaneogriseus subsp. noncyanogenus]|uniref:Uncharacterized protein n=1 Tax=Streptomyces cyaneogriseus subsp. noncyanogenus TaxID=477245 RepID=A0A0C5FUT6_9ACTN|nr:hypothetical protein TU94_00215 [Streptomyces cyaneogriseus subsp. noncyanogenus]
MCIEWSGLTVRIGGEYGPFGAGCAVQPPAFLASADDAFLFLDGVPAPEVGGEPDDPDYLIAASDGPRGLTLIIPDGRAFGDFGRGAGVSVPFGEVERVTGEASAVFNAVFRTSAVRAPAHLLLWQCTQCLFDGLLYNTG